MLPAGLMNARQGDPDRRQHALLYRRTEALAQVLLIPVLQADEAFQLRRHQQRLPLPGLLSRAAVDQFRHPHDIAPELPAAAVRALVRSSPAVRIVVTHADRSFIEEVHFGSTPDEAGRIWWDISWVWGPPEDHLQTLLGTMGAERFVFGTGQPLRIPESGAARLDLLDLRPGEREAIESGNVATLLGGSRG